jgi:transmembrane protein 216
MNQGNHESKIDSLLTLQILLYFNRWFVGLFVVLNIATFVYKGYYLPYPARTPGLGIDIMSVFIFAILEGFRIFTASLGNKTEQIGPVLVSILLGVGSVVMNAFFLQWQIYVLRIDVILNGISIAFIGLEMIVSIIAVCIFKSSNNF